MEQLAIFTKAEERFPIFRRMEIGAVHFSVPSFPVCPQFSPVPSFPPSFLCPQFSPQGMELGNPMSRKKRETWGTRPYSFLALGGTTEVVPFPSLALNNQSFASWIGCFSTP
jgi:hypothetical protein